MHVDEKVLNHLNAYLEKVEKYNNFDTSQALTVYWNTKPENKDFVALESQEYAWGFVSTKYKTSAVVALAKAGFLEAETVSFATAKECFQALSENPFV